MSVPPVPLAAPTETGATGILHLKRLWSKLRTGRSNEMPAERQQDANLANVLDIGLLPLYQYVFTEQPDFETFERWVADHHGGTVPDDLVHRCNRLMSGASVANEGPVHDDVLTAADLDHWNEHGYVIVRGAVSPEDCAATRALIWDFLGMQEDDPSTWHASHDRRQGIMVTLYRHPLLRSNRYNPIIRRAYEQLWGTRNLIVSADKVGFNPPETGSQRYKGAGIHWDVSLARPIPFGTQGILYLTDTAENGGALRVVPGFHRHIHDWLDALPQEASPRQQPLDAFRLQHIAANAGDFIIWHHALPHDGSPNTAATPRLVQYYNWFDPYAPVRQDWL